MPLYSFCPTQTTDVHCLTHGPKCSCDTNGAGSSIVYLQFYYPVFERNYGQASLPHTHSLSFSHTHTLSFFLSHTHTHTLFITPHRLIRTSQSIYLLHRDSSSLQSVAPKIMSWYFCRPGYVMNITTSVVRFLNSKKI
jgi:hypothetical protein